jgi:hypothetical protein
MVSARCFHHWAHRAHWSPFTQSTASFRLRNLLHLRPRSSRHPVQPPVVAIPNHPMPVDSRHLTRLLGALPRENSHGSVLIHRICGPHIPRRVARSVRSAGVHGLRGKKHLEWENAYVEGAFASSREAGRNKCPQRDSMRPASALAKLFRVGKTGLMGFSCGRCAMLDAVYC